MYPNGKNPNNTVVITKHTGIEVNGPANIQMLLDLMLEDGRISKEDHDLLVKQTKRTIVYMQQLTNEKGIHWSEVVKEVA